MNDRISKKIKKCLALSKSCNKHESKIAMNQAEKLSEKYDIDINLMENKWFNDENQHNDFLTIYSTIQLYEMWQESAKDTNRSYILEKALKRRTGKWVEELEKQEFKDFKKTSNGKLNFP